MPNVPVPALLRIELAKSGLVVWEAKRQKKGQPVSVILAGPGLAHMPIGFAMTIEEAVDRALRHPSYLAQSDGVRAAMQRLEDAVRELYVTLILLRPEALDDDIPF